MPSPDREKRDLGLIYHRIHRIENAPYDRGRTRTNPLEARAVAEAVMVHARRELKKSVEERLTLGVAAFGVAQMDAILSQVELLRRDNPSCEAYFSFHPYEPLFVKNLETVQGDERDVIFISVGYGRTGEGYLSMSFGPFEPAWRRKAAERARHSRAPTVRGVYNTRTRGPRSEPNKRGRTIRAEDVRSVRVDRPT